MKPYPLLILLAALTLVTGCRRQHNNELKYAHARSLYNDAETAAQNGETMESYKGFLNSLTLMDELTGRNRVIRWKKNMEYEHFTALIYSRIANFLYNYDAWDEAIDALQEANKNYEAENNLTGIAANLELMGDIMIAQSNRPEARRYYTASDSIHECLHDEDIYTNFSMLIHHAIQLFDEGKRDEAYHALQLGLGRADDPYFERRIYYALGHFYHDDQQLDSAITCYERSYPLLPRQTMYALCRIVQFANELDDQQKVKKYSIELADFYMMNRRLNSDKVKLITLYEKYKASRRDTHNKDLFLLILSILTLLALMVVIDTFWLERNRRRHLKDKAAHEHINRQLQNQLEQLTTESKNKEMKINDLEEKLKKIVNNPDFQHLPFDKKLETLYAMPICKRVRQVKEANVKAFTPYPELNLSDQQLTMLINAVDAVFPKFSIKIIERYPRLRHTDVIYCCLYILDITEVQAAALTGKTYQAVWTRSIKLHEIFNTKSSIQLVLFDILRNW